MKENLDKMVNRKVAGLDDIMLKKMLLAYYKGMYLDDTNVLIELTMDDLNIDAETWMSYMEVKKKKNDDKLWDNIIDGAIIGAGAGALAASGPGAIVGAIGGAIVGATATDYEVRVLLSDSGKAKLMEKYKDEIYPFEIIGGDTEEGKGEDGYIYLYTTGMVQIYDACENCETKEDNVNCTSCKKIIYYEEETLDAIYNEHYLKTLLTNEDYANSVLEYLKKCYTYTTVGSSTEYDEEVASSYSSTSDLSDAIKMYSIRKVETTQSTWEYVNESIEAGKANNPIEWVKSLFSSTEDESRERNLEPTEIFPVRAQYIQYSNKVAEYATPVEFLIDLMEIAESRDFVNAFIETVGNDNYIKLKLYTVESTTRTESKEEKNRTTTINGNREYSVKIIEYLPNGDKEWKSGAGGAGVRLNLEKDDNGNVKYASAELYNYKKDGTKYKVRLYVNENAYGSDVQLYFKDGWWVFDDDQTDYKWYMYMPTENSWTDTSKVIEKQTLESTEKKYDIAVTQIKTWYATITSNNIINRTITIDNLQGTQYNNSKVEIFKISNVEGKSEFDTNELVPQIFSLIDKIEVIGYSNETKTFYKRINRNIFEQHSLDWIETEYKTRKNNAKTLGKYDPSKDVYTMDECLNVQFNWTLQKGDQAKKRTTYEWWFESSYDYNYTDYIINQMTYTDSNRNKLTLYSNYNEELSEGLSDGRVTVEYDANRTFLGLLSNDEGEYYLGAAFKPQTNAADTGKLVEYKDLSGGKSKVGKLLENGAEMLYTLLESSERTQGLVEVMKYMMNEFENNNYSVTDFNFYVFNKKTFTTIEVK